MPEIQAAIANSTPEEARRAISNKTWLWTRGGGPYQVHYSTADGRDFAWLVGESRIFAGEWRIDTSTGPQGGRSSSSACAIPESGGPISATTGAAARPARSSSR